MRQILDEKTSKNLKIKVENVELLKKRSSKIFKNIRSSYFHINLVKHKSVVYYKL